MARTADTLEAWLPPDLCSIPSWQEWSVTGKTALMQINGGDYSEEVIEQNRLSVPPSLLHVFGTKRTSAAMLWNVRFQGQSRRSEKGSPTSASDPLLTSHKFTCRNASIQPDTSCPDH